MSITSRVLGVIVGALCVIVLGANGAWAQDVAVNYVPGTDFAQYKTYRWVEIEGAQKPDQIVDAQIRQAVEKVLASKGLTKVDGDGAALYIAYQVAIGQERQWNSYNTGGYGAWRYGGGMSTATSTTINIGTIALDMYDPAKKELVWKGQASKTIDEKASPEKRQKNLDKAMTKLLKNFPPKPKT
jgi:Domain of unknown function (DUF4136)